MPARRTSGGYSSADAYRAVRNPNRLSASLVHQNPSPPGSSHAHSSEEEAHLTAPMSFTPGARRAMQADSTPEEEEPPLSPPKPFFLAGNRGSSGSSDRQSWNSLADSSDIASDSDRDATDREGLVRPRQTTVPAPSSSSAAGAVRPRSNTAEFIAPGTSAAPGAIRPRNHHRRRSASQTSPEVNPFDTPPLGKEVRAPPSSFPFLSHAGNPDPGMSIPGSLARRASQESMSRLSGSHESLRRLSSSNALVSPTSATGVAYPMGGAGGYAAARAVYGERNSLDAPEGYGYDSQADLGRPHAPFMQSDDRRSWSSNGSNSGAATPSNAGGGAVYRNSAAGAMNGGAQMAPVNENTLPRVNSQPQIAMRAPFLSPASRPSSIWSPPSYPQLPLATSTYPPSLTYLPSSPYSSSLSPYHTSQPKRTRALMPSTRLESKLSREDKPWLKEKNTRERVSWWLTFTMIVLGFGAAAVICFFGWTGVHQLQDSDLCMVLNENFNTLDLDNTWSRDVEMGGFGNGEFQMTTASSDNLYIHNNQLYIMPTLTSDEIGESAVINGGTYNLGDACTASSDSSSDMSGSANCSAASDGVNVIPPVKSARLSTLGHYSIGYGKVEVRAKLPRGDWLWPAIWMLPTDTSKYGPWPLSGEIDIMEARGNAQSYPAQGVNFVRSSLNYGVLETLQTQLIGWWQQKRFTYAEDFHIYGFEWTSDWMRFYVDTKLQAMMNIKITGKGGKSFFDRGGYPATAHNGSDAEVAIENIWQKDGGNSAAPFDQQFYLILDLAVGGTSGWFPDGVGGKPWVDEASSAMHDFAQAQGTWSKTWPSSADDRAFRIDYVKMWKLGKCH